jgi:hypothetical protein
MDLAPALLLKPAGRRHAMASRPLAFGVRFREKGRTLRVQAREGGRRRYLIEDSRDGGRTRRREHASLPDALRDFAATWRGRLN